MLNIGIPNCQKSSVLRNDIKLVRRGENMFSTQQNNGQQAKRISPEK